MPSCSHTNKQLLQAEALVETAPDSAMTILKTYNYNKLSDKDKALYGLVYIKIRDEKLLPLEPDSLLEFSLKYYLDIHNDHEKLATCYFYKGKQFKNIQHYAKAIECFLYSYDLIHDNENYELIGKLFFEQGYINAVQGEYKLARQKLNKSIHYFKDAKLQGLAFNSVIYLGWSFHEEGAYNKAINYYKSFSDNIKDSLQKGVLWQEIAINYYKQKQFDSAKYYLGEVLNYPYLQKNKAKRYSIMADLCFDLHQIDSAIYYSQKTLLYNSGIITRRNVYRILANSYSLKGNSYKVSEYMSKYQDCNDSIRKIDSQTKGSYIETMHNTQQEAAKSRNWIWYLLISIVLIISGSVYLYITKHKRAERKLKLNEVNHSQQKAAIRKDIMMKKQTSLLTNIERIKTEQKLTEKGNAKFPERVKSIYNELLHIQDQALFFCEMDGALNSIVTKLKTQAPDIKDKELIWSCLHLLDVPTHDMLILLNYESVNSLKRMKGRLALKLGLENATLLNDYLLQLLTND